MNANKFLPLLILINYNWYAQERTNLNLKDALILLEKNNNEILLAQTKADTKKLEWQQAKDHQYPDIKIGGNYFYLTEPTIDLKLKLPFHSSVNPSNINQFMMGQANVSVPLFAGGKIKNSIQVTKNLYLAEKAKSSSTKEDVSLKVIEYYAQLYRSLKSVELIGDNIKSAEQRVKDFKNMEQNGIIARNDLLKAQLQLAKIKLSLQEANKNVNITNYALTTLLNLPEGYQIGIDEHQFDGQSPISKTIDEQDALQNRKDLEIINYLQKANENNIKIAQSNYFPKIGLSAGYIAMSLQNVINVTNAINIGGGISYDLSSLYKTSKEVKTAKNKAEELKLTQNLLKEGIKIQTQQSIENFNLAQDQNKVYQQAIEQASENYRIVKDKHDNGLATATELIDADVEQLNAKINYANSRANVLLKYYEMLATSGQLTTSFNLTK
ncbi:transporter [Flavobacterium covae]|uniref:TolC family protein n=1 Tax=Flavobacterium columnare TaxID=996 RepID=A0AA94EZK7_9FLAO|nr:MULTISPECIES: TolC family protein [Flavobacterium]OXA75215.1 transporter [Flavobacterium columnare] [Flavobacterium columnare NBRC 100251 = ATCC 23463]AND65053.1 transporter [Flavobacterium covae]MCH4830778.1 TolC family protein [Flavobacterium columnare]MCH4833285.1 TolC family protein [Flavobacterium columnare]MCJ1805508.1 TolC family protein [Flavobacterium covae]